MKKNKKTSAQKKKRASANAAIAEETSVTRRNFLVNIGAGIGGIAAIGGVGWWLVSSVRALAKEQDLTRLGSGIPTVVQIHDPQCSMCTELQGEARKALRCFGDGEIMYLVASIRTQQGAQFAAARGLPHVTLVLLDSEGQTSSILQGVRGRDELKDHFQSLVAPA